MILGTRLIFDTFSNHFCHFPVSRNTDISIVLLTQATVWLQIRKFPVFQINIQLWSPDERERLPEIQSRINPPASLHHQPHVSFISTLFPSLTSSPCPDWSDRWCLRSPALPPTPFVSCGCLRWWAAENNGLFWLLHIVKLGNGQPDGRTGERTMNGGRKVLRLLLLQKKKNLRARRNPD